MSRLRLSRKVLWFSTVLAIALVAAACSGTSGDSPATEALAVPTTATVPVSTAAVPLTAVTTNEVSHPAYGGIVVVANDQELQTLNPFVPGGDKLNVAVIGQSYFAGVFEIDGFTLALIPELVTDLPTQPNGGVVVNADGTMTVTYKILDDARWSDGTPITGADFQFTLDTILNPDNAVVTETYEDIISTKVRAKTFTYTLDKPTVLYELLFGVIIPKHDVEGSDFLDDWNATMWVSAGPFVFNEWRRGEFVEVVRNKNYWKKAKNGDQLPYLDSVVFRFISETESMIDAFKAREIDIIQPPPLSETIETLLALVPEGARVEVLKGPVWAHLNFQFGPGRLDRNPTSSNESLNYRKGVAHAIDKDLIVDEILKGQVEPLDSFVDAYSPILSQGSWAQYDYNPEKARDYFAAAKAELGEDVITTVFTTNFNNENRVKLSELLSTMFADVGVEYANDLEESQMFFAETLPSGKWDLAAWTWIGSPGLSGLIGSADLFDPAGPPPQGANLYNWGTPGSSVSNNATARVAEIRSLLNASVDEDVLVPLINELENILADEAVIIPLYQRLVTAAVWADEVGGFKHNPTSASYTWNIEQWYRVDI